LSAQTVLQLIAQGDCLDEVTVGQAVADMAEGLQESDLDELSGLSTVLNHLRTCKEAYIPVLSDQGAPVGVVSRDAVETAIQVVTSLDHRAATVPQPQPSIDREHLLSAVADQVRSSLETQHVLNYAVEGVRSLLDCSRVIVYQLRPDFSGTVVAEALDAGHRSVLHQEVQDPCVSPEWIEPYRSGKIRAVNDIYDAAISLCHQEMLTGFDIRAKLMAPIVIQGELWGLIVASHRDRPHVWTPRDVLLLRQLSTQVAIALHQAITHQQLQRELQTRQRIEALLLESEQRYASLTSIAPVGIFRADAEGNCTYVNDRYCQLTGRPVADLLGTRWQRSLYSEDYAPVIIAWAAIEHTRTFDVECRLLQPDGAIVWVYVQAIAERDEQGAITGYVGTLTDISGQKRAEVQLQNLISGTAAKTGQDFFPVLVSHISATLNVSHVLVTEQVGPRLQVLACFADGEIQSGFSYSIAQTPCERVLQQGVYYCESLVQQKFPEDQDLRAMESESYIGFALRNTAGKVMGHLCILNKRQIDNPVRARQILEAFAGRAAAELERQQANSLLEQLNHQLEAKVEERTADLLEREQFLRTVLDTFPLTVFWKDRYSVYLGCNRNFLKDANVSSVDAVIGKTDYDMPWANSEADSYRADDREVIESNRAKLGIIETQRQTGGKQIWVETNKLPLHNLSGDVIGVLGTYQDITERRQAQLSLQESEQRFRMAIANAPFPIMIHAEDGEILQISATWTELTGYTHTDVPTTEAWAQLAYGDRANAITQEVIARTYGLTSRWDEGESVIDTAFGTQQTWHFSSAPLGALTDGRRLVISMAVDITERNQVEAQIHALLNRTQMLGHISTEIRDSLDLGTILLNLVNSVVAKLSVDSCNFAWYQKATASGPARLRVIREKKVVEQPSCIGSYSATAFPQILNSIEANQLYRVDDTRTSSDTQLAEHLRQIGIATFLSVPIHTAGGRIGSLQVSRAAVRPWSDEEVELFQSIGSQMAIAIHQADLYQESKEKTEQLQRSYQELETAQRQIVQSEKMSSLGQLVAGIAHEINNPVGFIYGNMAIASDYVSNLTALIKLYQEHYPTPPTAIAALAHRVDAEYILADFPKLLASMENGATRIQNIVQSLRTFSRLDQTESSAVTLQTHIDATLVLLQSRLNGRAGNPEIHVVKQYGSVPEVECYSSLLDQVFMNLLVNAIDAIEERQQREPSYTGCITITTAIAPSGALRIVIGDNGMGMASETREKIFNPFFTTKPIGEGTGMGLAISYQIITGSHNGTLRCESIWGQGTEFTIELPQTLPQEGHGPEEQSE
ncbi:MAG: GAF domain-containing protein, partial [Cyanobacteria bacterium P01_A01_bin.135]